MKASQLARAPGARGVYLTQLPPLSLYVHLPWCIKKCPYCDFNSHEAAELPEQAYLEALRADLAAALPEIWGRSIQTVFIGGGTPSLFSPDAIDRLLSDVRSHVRLAAEAEITLEANPGTFERAKFAGFRQAGVNRLSIGIQSFNEDALRRIGRVHDRAQALAAAASAAELFPTFNLDLMYGLPGQDEARLGADLQQALAFAPPHLSYYHLTLEPNTLFASQPPANLPDEDCAAAMQAQIEAACAALGLVHYEVSAYARPGHRARHNLNYWQFGDYLGIGAGAHSKLSFHDRIVRSSRYRHPRRFMAAAQSGSAVEYAQPVAPADVPLEFMLNALRLTEGVATETFVTHTGLDLSVIAPALKRATDRGLLDPDPRRLRATDLGLRFLNDLQQLFMADPSERGVAGD